VAGSGNIDAAEVHLEAALQDRELDGAPSKQVEDPLVALPRARLVARERGREPAAVAVQDEPGERDALEIAGLQERENSRPDTPCGSSPGTTTSP